MTALNRIRPLNAPAQVTPAGPEQGYIVVRPRWTLVFAEAEAAAHVARTTDARALLPNRAASRLRWLALSAAAARPVAALSAGSGGRRMLPFALRAAAQQLT